MDETTPLGGSRRMIADRYELRGLIGQGGMADVELGYDTQLDRQVAVKILHARYASDDSFIARFRREAQSAASLNHPNVVGVFDTGEWSGRPYIVMEYVEGRSLKEVLQREGVLPERAAEIAGDTALALHYANQRGLVHRDIKPGNIMVSNEGEVKVTDFGIARAVNAENITQTAAVFGTAAYVAPEQAQGEPVDGRTDIYALGCVLYEMLTGRQPFQADSAVALAYQHVSSNPVPPSHVNPEVPPALEAVVLRAMAKNPDDRYPNGREMNADLQRAMAGMPVAAPPIIAYEQTQALDRTMVAAPVEEEYYEEEEYYDEPPPSRAGLWVLLILLLLAVVAVAGFLIANLMGEQEPQEMAQVPDLRGQELIDAAQALRDLGFVVDFADAVQTDEVAPGQVLETDPPAGTDHPVGEEVTIFFATGPEMTLVPNVNGLPEGEAQQLLREAQLSIGTRQEEPSDDVPAGNVIRAEPEQGTEVPPGTEVSLVVSSGEDLLAVPDVINLPEAQARERLRTFCGDPDCFTVTATTEFDDTIAEGRVIRTDPTAGEERPRGATVAIVVSRGAEPTPEPTPTPTPTPAPTPTPIPLPPAPSPTPTPTPPPDDGEG